MNQREALWSVLPERLHPGGYEPPVGDVQLWRTQCLVIPIVDGQNIRQLKHGVQALVFVEGIRFVIVK
jgi:hypothetical protein